MSATDTAINCVTHYDVTWYEISDPMTVYGPEEIATAANAENTGTSGSAAITGRTKLNTTFTI